MPQRPTHSFPPPTGGPSSAAQQVLRVTARAWGLDGASRLCEELASLEWLGWFGPAQMPTARVAAQVRQDHVCWGEVVRSTGFNPED